MRTRRVHRLRSPANIPSIQHLPPAQHHQISGGSLNLVEEHVANQVQHILSDRHNDATNKTPDSVRVVVRCRPMNAMERTRGDTSLFRSPSESSTTLQVVSSASSRKLCSSIPTRETVRNFQFDLCASGNMSQEQFFRACGVISQLKYVVDGYIATVFAYGQTGSGKTYTMSGLEELLSSTQSRVEQTRASNFAVGLYDGLIPRALKHLFELLEQASGDIKTVVRASYCEIYNEQVFDLLNPGSGTLNVRWNIRSGFFVQDLLVVQCDSLSDLLAVVDEGHRNRRVASHGMNTDSSRSHSLLTVHVDRTELHNSDSGQSGGVTRYGKINFVDLAGSERLKETNSSNTDETSNINRSLLTLGKVISALAALSMMGNSNLTSSSQYIPYRDSKLTKLLMDSLGGQSLTLMIACVSPSPAALEDTLSTLNYATRAKNIRNKPVVQVDAAELELSNLRRENQLLRTENNALLLRLQLVESTSAIQLQSNVASISSNSRLPPLLTSSLAFPITSLPNQRPYTRPHDEQEKLTQQLFSADRACLTESDTPWQIQDKPILQQQQQQTSNEIRQLKQQVQQLQQREQELMQALSRRSRGRRE